MANSRASGFGIVVLRLLGMASCAVGVGLGAWSLLGDGGAWGFVGIVVFMSGLLIRLTSSRAALESLHQPLMESSQPEFTGSDRFLRSA